MKNRLTPYIWLLLLFCSATSAECVKDPIRQTKTLFENGYFFYADSMPEVAEKMAPRLSNLLKKEFLCKSKGEICAIDFDPWLSAQDGEASRPYKFSATKRSGKAFVQFSYQYKLGSAISRTQSVEIAFSMTKRGCWLIDDFVSPSGDSILSRLEEWHAKETPTMF